ncbi:MAG: IMP dehydrogenase [Candidatus Riflebacteria bacterium]
MARRIILEPSRAITEFRLLPGFTHAAAQSQNIALTTRLAKSGDSFFSLNIPLVSAAMQAVSGDRMGIELARNGGLAFIFASQPIEEQAQMVQKVKNHKAGFVTPKVVGPETTIGQIAEIAKKSGFSTFPVVDDNEKLLGLLTRNDFSPERHALLPAKTRMIRRENLVVGKDPINLHDANDILMDSHQSVLPIVDGQDKLLFLVFRKDIENHLNHPMQVVDQRKRLCAGAAINTHDYQKRVPCLVDAETDILAIDSSDGHSCFQADTLDWCRANYPQIPVIGGNIVTADGFRFLAEHHAAAIKIGMGGGSICITQEQKGTGRGLGTAIIEVAAARDEWLKKTGQYIPLIADGGINTAKDMVIALALGADCIMLGRYFARLEESPTEKILINNRYMKPYWGEGSARAREWRGARYGQGVFAEGVEGYVEYSGFLKDNLKETLAIIKSSFCSAGAADMTQLHVDAVLEVVSALSIREGQPHDIVLSAPNSGYTNKSWGETR